MKGAVLSRYGPDLGDVSLHRPFRGRAEWNPIVEGTRIAVHDVIGLLQNGETLDTLTTDCLPQLTRSQVYECLAYYEDHRGEIDLLIARQMALSSE